jgi:hypothetical protein
MDEALLLDRIHNLARERSDLYGRGRHGRTPVDPDRLRQLQDELDRSWDLLRRRRAARSSGRDPEQPDPDRNPEESHRARL